ncbi:hypothetical protein [Haloarchaeobius sp. HRN-SO-5]|uniref:hypothetical protein n=1 Tax=Haloarchaeobius sp. HRN-SO-5 TaxID=3446118 RepID=UPI003EBCB63E
MSLNGTTDIGAGSTGSAMAFESGTVGGTSNVGPYTRTVTFTNTYKRAQLVPMLADQAGGDTDSSSTFARARWDSWVTDGSGNITGANLWLWDGDTDSHDCTWTVYGELA